jgi:hypothetical protein
MMLSDLLPIEYIFHLLCIYRRGEAVSPQAVRAAISRRGLRSLEALSDRRSRSIPRLSFWVRLCQSSDLLDENPIPYPTLLAGEWLGWPFLQQLEHLVKGWMAMPENELTRKERSGLLSALMNGVDLNAHQRRALPGLQALGVCEKEALTALGRQLISEPDANSFAFLPPASSWQIHGEKLYVPFPPDWVLLWELEQYLDPEIPYTYTLDENALRQAAQRGANDGTPNLPAILERGLGRYPPFPLLEQLAAQPTIHILPGPILEFSHPDELLRLRQSRSLRRHLDHMLSNRHVLLDPWQAPRLIRRLFRMGLLSIKDLDAGVLPATRPIAGAGLRLSKAERTYMLGLFLLAEALEIPVAPPPGLLARLAHGLDAPLRVSAARQATAALKKIRPVPIWPAEEEFPVDPPESLLVALQQSIDMEEAIDVLYRTTGQSTAEYRHLTPLLLEKRAGRYYLLAYCHIRRANRTFRVDRMKLVDHPF